MEDNLETLWVVVVNEFGNPYNVIGEDYERFTRGVRLSSLDAEADHIKHMQRTQRCGLYHTIGS